MTAKPPVPPSSPNDSEPAAGGPGAVRIQKRVPQEPDLSREKLCATCGRPFRVGPDEKFFNCPSCYRKTLPPRKAPRRSEAQILTQITCQECGTVEYLAFVPADVNTTYCRACFSKKRKELQADKSHLGRK